jgi:hypothetical protein
MEGEGEEEGEAEADLDGNVHADADSDADSDADAEGDVDAADEDRSEGAVGDQRAARAMAPRTIPAAIDSRMLRVRACTACAIL